MSAAPSRATLTGRSVPEWVGSTPDAKIPDKVKARIVLRQGGLCAITGQRLRPGHFDFDHELPLCLGGAHSEANLRAIVREAHKAKTVEDVKRKAKADRIRIKHLGLKSGRGFGATCRKMDGSIGLTKRAQREQARCGE
jgi:5-methylcytosine-specific restriction protein A